MDKRRAWREQELELVARWNAASERYRDAQSEISRQHLSPGDGVPSAEALLKAETARAEIEAMRKQIARLKVEFTNGKRY